MHDEAHVRAIDPHAERHGRDHDVHPLAEKRILVPAAFLVGEPGVIRQRGYAGAGQPRRPCVALAPRGAVDAPGLPAVPLAGGRVARWRSWRLRLAFCAGPFDFAPMVAVLALIVLEQFLVAILGRLH